MLLRDGHLRPGGAYQGPRRTVDRVARRVIEARRRLLCHERCASRASGVARAATQVPRYLPPPSLQEFVRRYCEPGIVDQVLQRAREAYRELEVYEKCTTGEAATPLVRACSRGCGCS